MQTYSTAEATEQIGAPSERWLIGQIRAGRFPARKVGRSWRMTDEDIADALDACSNKATTVQYDEVVTPMSGLTPTTRKRLVGR